MTGYEYASEETSHKEMDDGADVHEGSHDEDTPVWEPQQVCTLSREGAIYTQEVATVQRDHGG